MLNDHFDASKITGCISKDRLDVCARLLRVSSAEEAVYCYHHLQTLSSLCFIPLHYVEIVLRNKVHEALTAFYTGRKKTVALPGAPEEWYLWMPQRKKTIDVIQESIQRLRRGKSSPVAGDIIAQLPFGVWVSVLEELPDEKEPLYFWRGIKHAVFSNLKTPAGRRMILSELRDINNIRNRLFHHEPIWKTASVSSLRNALDEVRRKHDKMIAMLSWLSADMEALLRHVRHDDRFNNEYERIPSFYGRFV